MSMESNREILGDYDTVAPFDVSLYDIAKPVFLGVQLGFVVKGWTLQHYIVDAATKEAGYETCVIWGTQGNGKSSRMLQMLYWVYFALYENEKVAWDMVLDRIVFRPNDFIKLLEELPDDVTLAALGWDDIGVHYPSTKFKTDIKTYEAIDSTWAAIRTKVHVMIPTIPLIDRLAKNIKDNVTFELFIGNNQVQIINRWYRLPGFKENSNFFKVTIEKGRRFDKFMVPLWVWQLYWAKRIDLTKEALSNLKAVSKGDIEGMIPVLEAAEIIFSMNPQLIADGKPKVKASANTIQQLISRKVIAGERFGDILYVDEDSFYRWIITKGGLDMRVGK